MPESLKAIAGQNTGLLIFDGPNHRRKGRGGKEKKDHISIASSGSVTEAVFHFRRP
jgi:hypothetical protein